jgi:hypothetical protein
MYLPDGYCIQQMSFVVFLELLTGTVMRNVLQVHRF